MWVGKGVTYMRTFMTMKRTIKANNEACVTDAIQRGAQVNLHVRECNLIKKPLYQCPKPGAMAKNSPVAVYSICEWSDLHRSACLAGRCRLPTPECPCASPTTPSSMQQGESLQKILVFLFRSCIPGHNNKSQNTVF